MNNRIEKIKLFLLNANRKFGKLRFRCGYGYSDHTYIVEVEPLSEFRGNEEYAKMEMDFCDSFEKENKGYDIIFVSDGELCKVTNVLFEVGCNNTPQYLPNKIKFDFDFDKWVNTNSDTNKYALAA